MLLQHANLSSNVIGQQVLEAQTARSHMGPTPQDEMSIMSPVCASVIVNVQLYTKISWKAQRPARYLSAMKDEAGHETCAQRQKYAEH